MSGTLLTGRQALFMVYAAYEIDADRGALYDLSDLMRVTFKTDREMPSFLHTWSRTVQGLSEPQPEGNLRTLLFEQLQKSHALRPDMHYFDRLSRDHEDKTYQFLLNAAKRYVDRVKKKML